MQLQGSYAEPLPWGSVGGSRRKASGSGGLCGGLISLELLTSCIGAFPSAVVLSGVQRTGNGLTSCCIESLQSLDSCNMSLQLDSVKRFVWLSSGALRKTHITSSNLLHFYFCYPAVRDTHKFYEQYVLNLVLALCNPRVDAPSAP